MRTEYRIVTAGSPEHGCAFQLASFTEDQGGEKSARAFAVLALEANEKWRAACPVKPAPMKLELHIVTIKTEVDVIQL